jgi:simple sugar transport system ATP-binding protein
MTDPDVRSSGALAGTSGAGPPVLEMRGIRKVFGPVVALDGVDFEVGTSEVHGLLGGNGAGKTTLMNVLYGLYRPDAGSVRLGGEEIVVRNPRDAITHGIGMVHQNFLQVDSYTVTENIVLGTRQPSFPTLDLRAAEADVADLSERFGLNVDPREQVGRLSVGIRQRVEILKALYRGAQILVLDEPTSSLTPQEVDSLFGSLRAIVDEGMSVVFITHKIRETMAVCDELTIMRDGRCVSTLHRRDTTARDLAMLMVGDEQTAERVAAVISSGSEGTVRPAAVELAPFATVAHRLKVGGLTADNDHGVRAIHDLELGIARGEVLGIAGVAGNGQVELAESLAGVRPLSGGTVDVDGVALAGQPTAQWLMAGVAYVPEDRHRDGILPAASIIENLVLGAQRSPRFRKWGLIDWSAARRHAVETMSAYSVKASGASAAAATLSGGNIQRVILARAFAHYPGFLILHNPTRGLDIGSTQFVYDRVREAAAEGTSVLLISEDLDELTHLADRILVVYAGRAVGERLRGEYDQYELGRFMAGVVEQT